MMRRWLKSGLVATVLAANSVPQACSAEVSPSETVPSSILNGSEAIDFTVVVPYDLVIEYVPQFTAAFPVDKSQHQREGMLGVVGILIDGALDRAARHSSIRKGQELSEYVADLELDKLAANAAQRAFKDVAWLRQAQLPTSRSVEMQNRDTHAAILFEFGVLPTFDRVVVGCSLILEKGGSVSSINADARKPNSDIIFRADQQSTTEILGMSGDQASRRVELTADGGSRLKELLARNADSCASNAVRRALFSDAQLADLRMQSKTTVSTRRNQQFRGWILEGATNLVPGKAGALGISKTFVAAGTDGVLLLDQHFGLMRITALNN